MLTSRTRNRTFDPFCKGDHNHLKDFLGFIVSSFSLTLVKSQIYFRVADDRVHLL